MSLLDLADPAFKADPFPTFARLREKDPVHRVRVGRQTAWLVCRHEDADAALRDRRLVKDRASLREPGRYRERMRWLAGPLAPLMRNMLDVDEPDHRRLRSLVQQAFTRGRVDALEGRVHEIAEGLLDRLLDGRPDGDAVDLVAGYALPLPATVIAELLGVPASDRHRFHGWTRRIVASEASGWRALRAMPSILAFVRYIRGLIESRRATPRDDLLTALVRAEEEGDSLSEDELVAMVFLLLVAGHETTVNLIAGGTLALIRAPDQMDRLRRHPLLGASAVEELLRYCSPLLTATERWASEDVTIAGTGVARGDLVLAGIASANRDERAFERPDRLDLSREPNPHLSFGKGVHYCLGAPLARLEGRVAFETLLRRARTLELAVEPDALRWRRGPVLRGLEALPVRLRA